MMTHEDKAWLFACFRSAVCVGPCRQRRVFRALAVNPLAAVAKLGLSENTVGLWFQNRCPACQAAAERGVAAVFGRSVVTFYHDDHHDIQFEY